MFIPSIHRPKVRQRAQENAEALAKRSSVNEDTGPIDGEIPSLADFIQESWEILEPGVKLDWNWHIDAICIHLEAVLFDWQKRKEDPTYIQRIQNLLVNVPPGSLKSRSVSVCMPAWWWLYCPSWRAVFLSANPDVSQRDSMFCRDLIEHDWYQKTFRPKWKLRGDSNAKNEYWNTAGGIRKAAGILSKITGSRYDCVKRGTLIRTDHGEMPIEKAIDISGIKVLSYNHLLNRCEFRAVTAYKTVKKEAFLSIVTSSGSELECTDDHKIFSEGKYVRAEDLAQSDVLSVWREEEYPRVQAVHDMLLKKGENLHLRMPNLQEKNPEEAVRSNKSQEKRQEPLFLFSKMYISSKQSRIQSPSKELPILQQRVSDGFWTEMLLDRMLGCAEREKEGRDEAKIYGCLPGVQERIRRKQNGSNILFDGLQEQKPFKGNERLPESKIQGWPILFQGFRRNEESHSRERSTLLPGLWESGSNRNNEIRTSQIHLSHSSYRPRSKEQSPRESDHTVRQLPCHPPQLQRDPISSITRHRGEDVEFYDITVEGNHNFFANGILVHNCIVIDDPHDAAEIKSDAKRDSVINKYDNSIANRVNDLRYSTRIGIMQRLDERDWAQHVHESGEWERLCIRQEYEVEDTSTTIGWKDPRTTPGALMFPERFPRNVLKSELSRLGAQGYAAQHQQNPAPEEGGMFKIANWRIVAQMPEGTKTSILSVDASFKDTDTSDYVVIGNVIQIPKVRKQQSLDGKEYWEHQYYVKHRWKGRAGLTETEEQINKAAERHPDAFTKLIEDKANGPAIIDRLKGKFKGLRPFNPGSRSKEERAASVSPIQERGDVILPADDETSQAMIAMGIETLTIAEWWELHPPETPKSKPESWPVVEWAKDFISELSKFPNGANDDQVDFLSQALIYLEKNTEREAPPLESKTTYQSQARDKLADLQVPDRSGREKRSQKRRHRNPVDY